MDIERIISIFGPLFGIFIGWGLNHWSGLSKIKKENIKSLKTVLFNLLEVHFVLARLDDRKFVDKVSNTLLKHFSTEDDQSELLKKILSNQLLVLVREKFFPHILERLPIIKEGYEKSIDEIKGILPILAFKLSGKTVVIDYLNNLENIIGIPDMEGQEKQVNMNIMQELSPKLRDNLIDDFEDDILSLSRHIGIRTWFKTKKRLNLNRDFTNFNEDFDQFALQIKPIVEATKLDKSQMEVFLNNSLPDKDLLLQDLDVDNNLFESIAKEIVKEKEEKK